MNEQLFDELKRTALDVFRASAEKHAGEHFYCVALYTSGEYGYLFDSVCTTEGLEQVAKEYLEDESYRKEWGTLDVAMKELKWSPCDSPYHCEFADRLAAVGQIVDSIWEAVDRDSDDEYLKTCKEIHETCIAVLAEVRDSGIFDKDRVLFNLLMGDQSDEERLLNAESLNSHEAVDRFRSECVIDQHQLEGLRQNRWNW